jgi:NADPH2:quinone reductase
MKAFAFLSEDSGPEFRELPDPEPAPNEVLVAVEAASVNGMDAAVAAGMAWGFMPHTFPVVVGRDFAGTVAAVGESVQGVAVGTRVAGTLSPMRPLGPGTFGESLAVSVDTIAPVPDAVDSATAAAVSLAGVTALDLVDAAGIDAGDVVLISGATGGVGHLAVQLAAARGATVIATAAPGGESMMRHLGAAATVDYTKDIAGQIAAVAPDGVDAAIHLAGDPAAVAAALRSGGRLASAASATAEQTGRSDVEVIGVVNSPTRDKLGELLRLVAAGELELHIAAFVPFEDAAGALASFGAGKLGKIVLTRRAPQPEG